MMGLRRSVWILVLLLLPCLVQAQGLGGLSEADLALLNRANTAALSARTFSYNVNVLMETPSGSLQASGGGFSQSPRNGLFNRRQRAFSMAITGNETLLTNAGLPFNLNMVIQGEQFYLQGGAFTDWVQFPLSSVAGGGVNIPTNPNSDFLTVARQADRTIDGRPAAVFLFTYDMQAPVIRDAIGRTLGSMPTFGGALASGSDAGALLQGSRLTLTQAIDLDSSQLRHADIDFVFGDTHLTLNIGLNNYDRPVNIQVPSNAQGLNLADLNGE
ncbi:MAG: hypothetical protein ACOYL5_07430 [Phototrophicaceae bacterium]|jgi:hypothetical protein